MNKNSKIYVAGHTGLVGSALVRKLKGLGYHNLLVRTHSKLELADKNSVDHFFRSERPEYVFLAAAKVGGILANHTNRAVFLEENLRIQNNVLSAAYEYKVAKLLFLGSSCVYPKSCPQPIVESSLLTGPLEYTNEPYAIAKIAGLKLCESYNLQYGTNFITVMPTNIYGPGDNYDLRSSHVLPALIKKCVLAKLLSEGRISHAMRIGGASDEDSFRSILSEHKISKDYFTIWGTGKASREFLHSDDLAEACIFVTKTLDYNRDGYNNEEIRNTHINVGSGSDLTISKLAEVIKSIVGFKGVIRYDNHQPDGTLRKLLDSNKLTKLGWKPKIKLEDGIRQMVSEVITKQ